MTSELKELINPELEALLLCDFLRDGYGQDALASCELNVVIDGTQIFCRREQPTGIPIVECNLYCPAQNPEEAQKQITAAVDRLQDYAYYFRYSVFSRERTDGHPQGNNGSICFCEKIYFSYFGFSH